MLFSCLNSSPFAGYRMMNHTSYLFFYGLMVSPKSMKRYGSTLETLKCLCFSWYVYKYIKCLVNHSPRKLWNLLHLLMLMLCCIDTQVIDVIWFQCVEKRKTFWRADIAFYCREIFCIDFHHCNARLLLKGVEERNLWGEDGLIGLDELRNFLRRRRCNSGSYSTCFSKCYVVKSFVN